MSISSVVDIDLTRSNNLELAEHHGANGSAGDGNRGVRTASSLCDYKVFDSFSSRSLLLRQLARAAYLVPLLNVFFLVVALEQ